MNLKKYIILRLFQTFITLLGISLLIFFLSRVIPGDPVKMVLGEEARPEQIEKLRSEMNLDKPFFIQYFLFLSNLIKNREIGLSSQSSRDALKDVFAYFPPTFELVVLSMSMALLIGIALGIISSQKRNKWIDHFVRVFTISGVSIPQFLVAIILQLCISYGLSLLPITGRIQPGINPPTHITGLYIIDSILTGNVPALISSIKCIILPAISLSLSPIAWICRYTRNNMVDETVQDYVIVSEANGLSKSVLTYKHMLRNSISPVLSQASLAFAFLLGNAFIIETIFAWPGMASYLQRAAIYKDINGIVAVTLIIGLFYLFINFFVDLAYLYLDPRIRI